MTPNHAIFRRIFAEAMKVTDRTFDYLPDAETEYPFIYVGENLNTTERNFDIYGIVLQTVHIYGLRTDRLKLDELTSHLLGCIRQSRTAYDYAISYQTHNQQDAPDNTDVQPLIHRVLDISFSYSKKGN